MMITGIGDEAGVKIQEQIAAARELGWQYLEPRAVVVNGGAKANLHDVPDAEFDQALRLLEEARVGAWCFGSTIMNWAKRIQDPFQITIDEVNRAIPRMQRLGTKFVRIMSFKPEDDEYRIPVEVFRRVKEVTNRFLDAGIQPLHENCMNYGGMSWQHALELLDKCPGLKWVFDTGNPIGNPDRSKPKPWPKQDPWEFWQNLRDHTLHIHVKDAVWETSRNGAVYTWPGQGAARVRDIIADAMARGYGGALSIEPHMVVVFHDPQAPQSGDLQLRKNFVDYARRLQDLVEEVKAEVKLK